MIGHLKVLEKRATIKFNTDDPQKLAYKLREALFAAQFHDGFRQYAVLREHYKFSVIPGAVIARYSGVKKETLRLDMQRVDAEILSQSVEGITDDHGAAIMEAVSSTSIPNVSTLDAVIGSAIKYGTQCDEIYFPDARLAEQELTRLWRWARAENWKIIDSEDAGITLTQKEVPAEICWSPNEAK